MRYLPCLFIFLLMVPFAQADEPSEAFLADFVVGRYHLIGRQADGKTTYQGRVDIFRDPQHTLKVRRTICGRVIEGTAAIEKAAMAETQVLRMRFTEAGIPFESTCLIQGDLDNYARLSCLRYSQDGEIRQPALEALFHDGGSR
ncbi:MAG: hypothetical protein P8010_21300 [Desulfosarcinaceae bacterium]|jgi:hypothetical protein